MRPVTSRVGVDRVGLERAILQHLADDALLIRQTIFLRDAGIEGRRRNRKPRLGCADQKHRNTAVARELHHLAHVALGLLVAQTP